MVQPAVNSEMGKSFSLMNKALFKIIKPYIKNQRMGFTQLILPPTEIFQDIIHMQVTKVN